MATNGEGRLDALERICERNVEAIEKLVIVAQAHRVESETLRASTAALKETVTQPVREWQAYLRLLPVN